MSKWVRKKKTKPALWLQLPGRKPGARLARHTAEELKQHRKEARAFVRAEIRAGKTCPVVAAVYSLQTGRRYGHPVSNRLTEVHHVRGRAGSLLRDQRYWLAVSKQGHRWVHANPAAARRLGFLCEAGLWNVPEKIL